MVCQMTKTIRYTLLSLRDLAVSAGPFILLAVTLLVLAYWWLDPNPPKRVVLATGPAQSAYEEFGKRYARVLKKDGIEVVLLPSEGSAANLQLLREGKADLGFVQGGSNEGGIDSNASYSADSIKTATNYVRQGVNEALAGKALSKPVTAPYGCSVKYKNGSPA